MVKQVIDVNFLTSLPQERFHVSQYDYGERVFEMHAYVGDDVWEIPLGSTVMLTGHKPSDPPTSFFIPCTFEGNVVICDCKETMTDVFGLVDCELSVNTSSGLIQSTNIILDVEKAPVQTGDIPSSDYEAIQTMIAHSGESVAQAAQYAAQAAQQAQLAGEKADDAAQYAAETAATVDNKITEFNEDVVSPGLDSCVKKEDLSSSNTITTKKEYAVDAWQLNPDNEGSYAEGVETKIADLATKPSVPTTGFTFEDYGSFKTGNIQYIKCRIALGALYSGYVPILNNPTLAKNPFIAHVSVEHASKIFNSVIRVTQMQTELFYTEEIRALGNTTINVYVDTFYEIKRE